MPPFFPRNTTSFTAVQPSAVRRISLSLVEMAALTGVVLRLLRAFVLTHGPSESLLYLVATFAVGTVAFFGMATLHLGNFTVRRWLWRVPVFAAVESLAEMLTSALLIAVHREPLGTSRAEWADWPRMAADVLLLRVAILALFALVLAGVVELVRNFMLRRGEVSETIEAWEADEGK